MRDGSCYPVGMKASSDNPWPARLAAARRKLGLTLAEMAKALDLPGTTYDGWEYGFRRPRGYAEAHLKLRLNELLEKNLAASP